MVAISIHSLCLEASPQKPGSLCQDELATAARSKKEAWDTSKIHQVIKAIHDELGVDALGAKSMQKDKLPERDKIIKRILGQARSSNALYLKARVLYADDAGKNGWPRAVEAAGVKATRVSQVFKNWNRDLILTAIKTIHAEFGPQALSHGAMQTDTNSTEARVLYQVVGASVSKQALYIAARHEFTGDEMEGAWDRALRAAQIDPLETKQRAGYELTRKQIVEALQAIHLHNSYSPPDKQISLQSNSLKQDRSDRTTRLMRYTLNLPHLNGAKVYREAHRLFEEGYYQGALKAAGIEPSEVIGFQHVYTNETVIQIVQALEAEGFDLSSSNVQNDFSTQGKDKVASILEGRGALIAALYQAGVRLFGSWRETLIAAGVDPKKHRKTIAWDTRLTLSAMATAHAAELAGEPVDDSLKKRFGTKMTLQKLLLRANRDDENFGSLTVLREYERIKSQSVARNLTEDEIKTLLHELHKAGFQLTSSLFEKVKPRQAVELMPYIRSATGGETILPSRVIRSLRETHGTFEGALRAVDINPYDHATRLPVHLRRSQFAGQLEFSENPDGSSSGGFLLGKPTERPDEIIEQAELTDLVRSTFGNFRRHLSSRQAAILDEMLELMAANDAVLGVAEITEEVNRRNRLNVSLEEVEEIFILFQSNERLAEINGE